MPSNPSISFTLNKAVTETKMEYHLEGEAKNREISVLVDGVKTPSFVPKISTFFERLSSEIPWIDRLSVVINTQNTFPHSSGIASSASAMSALALCIYDVTQKLGLSLEEERLQLISHWSRLGSGSASRSVFPYAAAWGETKYIEGSNQRYAVGVGNFLHPVFKTYYDSILIASTGQKEVSSTVGHKMMSEHPYRETRFRHANERMPELLTALKNGDVEKFGIICEAEAMELHALMMTSSPSFILMKPATIEIISRIKRLRKEEGVPVYFTLDAGPNVHMLYPEQSRERILRFINEELEELCENGFWIDDKIGQGPEKI